MKTVIFVVLLWIHSSAAVTHSLRYSYTGSSQVPNLPEYQSVGLVNEVQISHCDSNTNRNVPKQDWMSLLDEDPLYWEQQTEICLSNQPLVKANIYTAQQRFNQTCGIHILQYMYGCEWDDETGEVNGYLQVGYDGEDFIAFDIRKQTWIAPTPQAVFTKHKWDNDRASTQQTVYYLNQICPERLEKYVNYGKSSRLRTGIKSQEHMSFICFMFFPSVPQPLIIYTWP
uniref:MHC class I-like antigen recognition-like domain-containing protein n=1 Tax=Anabas testudineus TaxID=64144 RepID=A0A3Q1JRY6_ANATE